MASYEPLLHHGCHGQVGNIPTCPQEAENGLVSQSGIWDEFRSREFPKQLQLQEMCQV